MFEVTTVLAMSATFATLGTMLLLEPRAVLKVVKNSESCF